MIDLRNIARQLRLPADQLRLAADLLQQGYQPCFIAKYRSDETGGLPEQVLWPLKLGIEWQQRLEAAKQKAILQLGEGVELDDEARSQLDQCTTEVEVESILRAFRARKAARQTGERTHDSSQLLERMIAYRGEAVTDVSAWVAAQLSVEPPQAELSLQHCARLVSSLIAGDARLSDRLRHAIQKRSSVRVELLSDSPPPMPVAKPGAEAVAAGTASTPDQLHGAVASENAQLAVEGSEHSLDAAPSMSTEVDEHGLPDGLVDDHEHLADSHDDAECSGEDSFDAESVVEGGSDDEHTGDCETSGDQPKPAVGVTVVAKASTGTKKKSRATKSRKPLDKLTPRQRRRRWLISILQPFRSLNMPLSRLSSYQLLMLGRGQRSQLARLKLMYDAESLFGMARDVFVAERHPLASWFTRVAGDGLKRSLLPKLEADAVMELEELAQQRLLESATEQLRMSLLQRPLRGHCILVIDTVGPKLAAMAIVDHNGNVLATDEINCAGSQPSIVSQNLMQLGELVHRFKVTLVALSNGPARRFLIHTVAELMRQSADTNLRWSMVDRGSAEAYAASRIASEELPQYNRRIRVAVWMGRRLQDPLREMLKVDPSRLRLGSYQRELPQDSMQHLVHDTIADCLAVNGVDTLRASANELEHVPGVGSTQASQIAKLVAQDKVSSRADLLSQVENWPAQESRQALGFLRVYGSSETLDATAIHLEDYRLAQRVIQNTDLNQPPAAPSGWVKPVSRKAIVAAESAREVVSVEASLAEGDSVLAQSESSSDQSLAIAETDSSSPDGTEAGDSVAEISVDSSIPLATGDESSGHSEGSVNAKEPQPAACEDTFATPEFPEDAPASGIKTHAIDIEKHARSWQVGRAKLNWVASCLHEPFADQRFSRPWPPLQHEVPTLESLKPGMSVWAVVVGVADFGAFVELGPECSGLIHISRLSAGYIEDPHERVQIGDVLQTWVVSTDTQKRRVALTVISPEEQRAMDFAIEQQRESQRRQQERDQAPTQRRFDGNRENSNRGDRAQNTSHSGDRQPRASGGGGANQGGGRRQGRGGPRSQSSHAATEIASKPVVVKSKQPKKPITDAMQKGQEPLRSFSDLLQFYELQRTDDGPPPAIAAKNDEAPPPTLDGPIEE